MKKLLLTISLVSLGFGAGADNQVQGAIAAEGESKSAFVWVQPGMSTFWHTATNHVMTVPIVFPEGATMATLSIRGDRYSVDREIQRTGNVVDCAITLPEPKSQLDEDVYVLELTFDDPSETVRRARLGLIRSAMTGGEGVTRCLVPAEGHRWGKTAGRAVLWVPYDMTSLTVNGEDFDPQLDGDQGWCVLTGLKVGETAQVEMVVDGETYSSSLRGGPCGLFIVVE